MAWFPAVSSIRTLNLQRREKSNTDQRREAKKDRTTQSEVCQEAKREDEEKWKKKKEKHRNRKNKQK